MGRRKLLPGRGSRRVCTYSPGVSCGIFRYFFLTNPELPFPPLICVLLDLGYRVDSRAIGLENVSHALQGPSVPSTPDALGTEGSRREETESTWSIPDRGKSVSSCSSHSLERKTPRPRLHPHQCWDSLQLCTPAEWQGPWGRDQPGFREPSMADLTTPSRHGKLAMPACSHR